MTARTYPFAVGDYEAWVIYDFSAVYSADDLFANAPAEMLKQIAREKAVDLNNISVGYNNVLLKVGPHTVLVDAGIGPPIGELLLGLDELGVSAGQIDLVVITHSDRDHIGGIVNEEGGLSFPNARYAMLEDSWEHWSSEKRRAELVRLNAWTDDRVEFAWATYSMIEGLLDRVAAGETFLPGISLLPAPGHRQDHAIVLIPSSGQQLAHLSDAITHPLFMFHDDWVSTYDADPAQAVETKSSLLNLCASENALVFGAHFPFPGLGHCQSGPGGWKWLPVNGA